MPELAEVEFYRKRWHQAAVGERVVGLLTHDTKKLLRELDLPAFRRALIGATFESSAATAKQMLFRFSGDVWLGIHLGMSGELTVAPPDHVAGKHDHLVIVTEHHALVFNDPRNKDVAKLVATSLGATGKVRLDHQAPDTVDLTIVLGSDILGKDSGGGTPGSTVPTTGG